VYKKNSTMADLSGGETAGIVIGVIIGCFLLGFLWLYLGRVFPEELKESDILVNLNPNRRYDNTYKLSMWRRILIRLGLVSTPDWSEVQAGGHFYGKDEVKRPDKQPT
jgi:hypothetical protein